MIRVWHKGYMGRDNASNDRRAMCWGVGPHHESNQLPWNVLINTSVTISKWSKFLLRIATITKLSSAKEEKVQYLPHNQADLSAHHFQPMIGDKILLTWQWFCPLVIIP